MADQKFFGPEGKTVADAARELEVQSSRATAELSVDHAVFAEARQASRGAQARPPSEHGPRMPRAASPHLMKKDVPAFMPAGATTARGIDPQVTVSMPVLDKRKPADSPIARAQEAPEISLTQHVMPTGPAIDPRLVLMAEPDSEQAARFRILRHHLMDHGRPQVVVVSSPGQGEGKTTCAINLALALAECGRARVLLVEASVRRPQLAGIFRFVPPWCFAEQLQAHRHQPLLPWAVVEIKESWLHVAAVNPQIEQNQLLDAPAFAIAMERLRLASYDHIVIDAPAVLGSAEVNLMQDAADGVLLTSKAKHTTARQLRTAVEQLSPTKVIGTLLMEC